MSFDVILKLISELFSLSPTSSADMLAQQLVTGQTSAISEHPFAAFILAAVFCFLFGAVGAFVYKLTKRDEPVSWNFVLTLAMLPAAVSILFALVNDNLARSLGLTGIFALVRFRSTPGDPKDLACIVFSLGCGIAGGLKLLAYAAVIIAIFCGILLISFLVGLTRGKTRTRCKLKITVPENMCWDEIFDEVLKKYSRHYALERIKTVELGSFFELAYEVTLKPNVNEKELIDEIRTRNGNLTVLMNKRPDTTYEA